MVLDISSTEIASNWWIDISKWEGFTAILQVWSKLSNPSIVTRSNSLLELLENSYSYIDLINDNGNNNNSAR